MKVNKSLMGLCLGLGLQISSASALEINFDDIFAPSTFDLQTPLADEYAHLGVHFSGSGEVLNSGGNFGGVPLSPPFSPNNFLAFNKYADAFPPETVSFDYAISSFSLDFAGSSGIISLAGYSGATLIDQISMNVTSGIWSSLSISGGLFDSIVFSVSNTDGHFVVDNLSIVKVTSVPEPASLAILALGVAGIGFSRRTNS